MDFLQSAHRPSVPFALATAPESMSAVDLLQFIKASVEATIAQHCDPTTREVLRDELKDIWSGHYMILESRLQAMDVRAEQESMYDQDFDSLMSTSDETPEIASWLLQSFYGVPQVSLPSSQRLLGVSPDAPETALAIFQRATKQVMILNRWKDLTTPQEVNESLQKLGEWDFNVFDLAENSRVQDRVLSAVVLQILKQTDLHRTFDLPLDLFMNWISEIEMAYKDVPYHNNLHATEVTASTFFFTLTEFCKGHMTPLDMLTGIVSAAIHDVGHNGKTNVFHVNSSSKIALTYNDNSVLENYHVSTAFMLMRKPECDWMAELPDPVKRYIRHGMIQMVLATDMNGHKRLGSNLKRLFSECKIEYFGRRVTDDVKSDEIILDDIPLCRQGSTFGPTSLTELEQMYTSNTSCVVPEINERCVDVPRVPQVPDEKLLLMQGILHACDLSHVSKPMVQGEKWTERVMKEFFEQGDEEERLGLPVSLMCDRRTAKVAKSQASFIRFVVMPHYKIIGNFIQETKVVLQLLEQNLASWEKRALRERSSRVLVD